MASTGEIIPIDASAVEKPSNREDWRVNWNGRKYNVVKIACQDIVKGLFTLPASQGAFGITLKCEHPQIIDLAKKYEMAYQEAIQRIEEIEKSASGKPKHVKNAAIEALRGISTASSPKQLTKRIEKAIKSLDNANTFVSVDKRNIKSLED